MMSESRRPKARIVHDARGNAVWDWAVATGVLAKKTIADLIKTLDAPGAQSLSLERETPELQRSCDPYNRPARVATHRRAR
jgi:hypothetical protein